MTRTNRPWGRSHCVLGIRRKPERRAQVRTSALSVVARVISMAAIVPNAKAPERLFKVSEGDKLVSSLI